MSAKAEFSPIYLSVYLISLFNLSTSVSRRDKIRIEVIKDRINVKNSIVDFIETKKLQWYVHTKEWHKKDCQVELWNGPHQEEG